METPILNFQKIKRLYVFHTAKKFLSIAMFLLFFIGNVKAQNSNPQQNSTVKKTKTYEWKLLLENEAIRVNYKYSECNFETLGIHSEDVYLQIINKTSKEIKLDWDPEYATNGNCGNCGNYYEEAHRMVTLNPNQTVEGLCSLKANPSLVITSKRLDVDANFILTDFNLANVKITFFNE